MWLYLYLQNVPTLRDLIIIPTLEDFMPGFNHLEFLDMEEGYRLH